MPECIDGAFEKVIQTYRQLFRNTPGKTASAQHYTPTSGPALKVSPHGIPAEYRDEVEQVINLRSTPWIAPAVYVRNKDENILLCVDYQALNKQLGKDVYPLLLPDEILAGSILFLISNQVIDKYVSSQLITRKKT